MHRKIRSKDVVIHSSFVSLKHVAWGSGQSEFSKIFLNIRRIATAPFFEDQYNRAATAGAPIPLQIFEWKLFVLQGC